MMSYVVVVVVLLSLTLWQSTLACPPEVCVCKWKGGKQSVECGGQQLPNLPDGMDPGTQVLNFSGNALQVLQSERFLRMDLLNLQKIYLSRNQLIRIHEKAFRGLTNLVELDLGDNALQHVPSETFQDYSSLMRLSLSGNPIRELKTAAFRHLAFLTTLELSNCQIDRIENEAFVGMANLEWLRLDGNRIAFIQGTHILPKSLHGISLHSNRWHCDCRLLDVHSWLVDFNTPLTEEPKCMEPARLKGQLIKGLRKQELACLPEVSPQSSYNEVSEGRNMSIACVVRAIPEPKVLWLFNGQVMSNDSLMDSLHMYYYIDESGGSGAEQKRSEIFIYNVGAEDNGTFSCVGQNIAGTTFSNYTLRVIIKEPPVVNEVSFPRDYMNYIVASSVGGGIIFAVLLVTIVVKCKQRAPAKRKKCAGGSGAVTSITNGTDGSSGGGPETGLMKCASILNDGDSLNNGAGLLLGDTLTPSKLCKQPNGNAGGIILGGQIKQNLLLYAPTPAVQQHQQQQHMEQALQLNVAGSPPTAAPLLLSNGLSYCSPPGSLRNYQEKNPDLVNDAESVKHKLKTSTDGDYDAASDCSGPCSIQSSLSQPPVQYEGCYQLATPQILGMGSRFATAMTTLPRGMHLKSVLGSAPAPGVTLPQHQVDVHLNPVCFLGQDGFAYDYSSAHIVQQAPAQQAQTQNFYRTLPHNRAHKQQQFAASAQSPNMRYSLEAELVQRASTPTGYEKYTLPNVRFTAEGYPSQQLQLQQQQQQQFPSPPEGYKSSETPTFQQWPSCLPGYHAQPVHYPTSILSMQSPSQVTPLNCNPPSSSGGKRCTAAQADNSTIPECDETEVSPSASNAAMASAPPAAHTDSESDASKLKQLNGPLADSPDEGYVGEAPETSDI